MIMFSSRLKFFTMYMYYQFSKCAFSYLFTVLLVVGCTVGCQNTGMCTDLRIQALQSVGKFAWKKGLI